MKLEMTFDDERGVWIVYDDHKSGTDRILHTGYPNQDLAQAFMDGYYVAMNGNTQGKRTRLWEGEMTSTAVQVREDVSPMVWMHTNIGWIPVSNAPTTWDEAEKYAVELAEGYDLTESSPERAREFAC